MALVQLQGPVIRAGEALSEGLDATAGDLLRVTMPEEWDDAPLTFRIGSIHQEYHDAFNLDGFEVMVKVVVPDSTVIVPFDVSRSIGWIKFRSGTRTDPIPQSAERQFRVALSTYQQQTVTTEPFTALITPIDCQTTT